MSLTTPDLAEPADFLPFTDADYRANPYPFYDRLRSSERVHHHPDGIWVISGYDEIAKLLYDRSLSVAEIDFGPAAPLHDSVLGADAPEHTRLRRALGKWFTPKAVQHWSALAKKEINNRLDIIVANGGTFDAVHDLAFPVTFSIVSQLLGVPVRNALEVRKGTHDIGASLGAAPTDADAAGTEAAFAWFRTHQDELIAWKENNPGDGLLDSLLELERHGSMSRDEIHGALTLLYAVGHLDITFLIANGIRLMAEDPSIAEIYRTNPASRGNIINEILRLDTPEQFVTRMTTQDTIVGDVTIPAGEIVILLIAAANRDPEMYPQPDVFDHTRDASLSKHLAFGAGIHGCAGQVLARAEADAVFEALSTRFPTLRLNGTVDYDHTDFLRVISSLPVATA
jgi:cytochrome P450